MARMIVRLANDNTSQVLSELDSAVAKALDACAKQAETYAKLKCPVGTPESTGIPGYIGGTLRGSINSAVDDNAAYIGSNLYYAPYVELGTSKMKARPFLRTAISKHKEEYRTIIEQYLKA